MTVFQITVTTLGSALLLFTIAAAIRGAATRREALFWSLLWVGMVVAVNRPDLLTGFARRLGIGRGADLLLYATVIAMLVGFVMFYARLRRLRRELTILTRELALRDAARGSDSDADGEGADGA